MVMVLLFGSSSVLVNNVVHLRDSNPFSSGYVVWSLVYWTHVSQYIHFISMYSI